MSASDAIEQASSLKASDHFRNEDQRSKGYGSIAETFGQDIVARYAVKPTSSIRIPRRSINKQGEPVMVSTEGRHNPCVGIRATPIAEAMLALVLMDHALRNRGQCGEVECGTMKLR